jgi:hypothetical protein
MDVKPQTLCPSRRTVIKSVAVARCLFAEGHLTQDQSVSIIAQYPTKGLTEAQVKEIT